MYKNCVTEQSARRQRQFEAGLLTALATRNYEDITISDLCDSLGVPRKSFYRYFSGKEGILYALIDHTLTDYSGEVFADEEKATKDTLERFFAFWLGHRLLLDALERNNLIGILVQRSIARAMGEEIMSDQLLRLRPTLSRDYIIIFMVSGLMTLVVQWHKQGYCDSPRQMAELAANLLTKPLFSVSWQK